jgi:hypothetical protein
MPQTTVKMSQHQDPSDDELLSVSEVARRLNSTFHRVMVACALSGVIPRKTAQTYAIRREDLDLLRAKLGQGSELPLPAA